MLYLLHQFQILVHIIITLDLCFFCSNTELSSFAVWFADQVSKALQIASVSKSKNDDKTKKVKKNYIPPEKRQQIIDDLRLF